jgi:hypothetical protein
MAAGWLASAGVSVAHGVETPETFEIVTIKLTHKEQLKDILDAGFDVAGISVEEGTVDVIVDPKKDDFTEGSPSFKGLRSLNILERKTISSDFAPDPEYKNPDEIGEILEKFAQDYPNLTRLESIGKTTQGRDIWALKITDNPDTRELDESTILFNGMHHAREIMTPEVVIDTAEYLLTNYGTDAQVTDWVDGTEIWLVPMVNPDGNNKVWNGSSMWRKNVGAEGYGVDINRNYPYMWNACNGSSGNRNSDTYRGPSPGSEPETQALMGLVARIQPVFDISYHSYSELVLYPYGCQGERTPTKEVVEGIGNTMAGLLETESGRGTYEPGTPWDILYGVDGGDIDWMYNAHHVIPYVIELNSRSAGFQPRYSLRQPTVEKMRKAWGLLMDRMSGSGVRGVIRDGSGRVNPNTQVRIESLGTKSTDSVTWNVKDDGTYHIILIPGMYNLTFISGTQVITEEVTIGDTRVDLDIHL